MGLGSVWTATASVAYPPTYVWRVLAWRESDVYDLPVQLPATSADSRRKPLRVRDGARRRPRHGRARTGDVEEFLAEADTEAFILIQDGQVRYESYFGDWQRDSMVTSFSVAKAFTSTLVGIAIEEGTSGASMTQSRSISRNCWIVIPRSRP